MKKYIEKRTTGTFKIQITSMVDMFVILLVFLLKSYSTSSVQITPSQDLRLPASTSPTNPVSGALKLIVSEKAIYVGSTRVVTLDHGHLPVAERDLKDPLFIPALYQQLNLRAQKTRSIAQVNNTVQFDGKVLMQADRHLDYRLLQKVMYTSSLAGYADMKLAVLVNN